MMMRNQIKASIEAILFVRAEQITIEELAELLGISLAEVSTILEEMITEYSREQRGIQIVVSDNTVLMCSKPEYSDILSRMTKTVHKRLSPAAMETLAIIAYKQPVTRVEIEKIRGVKVDKILNNLLEKGLIEEVGYKDVVGKPVLYGTGTEFLRVFGLSSLEELPRIEVD